MKKCVATVMTLVSFPFNLFAVVLPQSSYTDMDMSYDGQSVYNSGIYGDEVLNAGDFAISEGGAEIYAEGNCYNRTLTPEEAVDELRRRNELSYFLAALSIVTWQLHCVHGVFGVGRCPESDCDEWFDEVWALLRSQPDYDPDGDPDYPEPGPPLPSHLSTEPVFLAVLLAGFAVATNRKRLFGCS